MRVCRSKGVRVYRSWAGVSVRIPHYTKTCKTATRLVGNVAGVRVDRSADVPGG